MPAKADNRQRTLGTQSSKSLVYLRCVWQKNKLGNKAVVSDGFAVDHKLTAHLQTLGKSADAVEIRGKLIAG